MVSAPLLLYHLSTGYGTTTTDTYKPGKCVIIIIGGSDIIFIDNCAIIIIGKCDIIIIVSVLLLLLYYLSTGYGTTTTDMYKPGKLTL